MRASKAAFDLIIKEEVGSEATYRKKYQRPEWPGVRSGATIGIGYDLGQTPASTIRADWGKRVPSDMLESMVWATGKTGQAGRTATARIRDDVLIPWDMALAVHKECVVPRWEARVAKALPNTDKLPGDCFGAILSLSFNRGTSFSEPGDRYKEMRAIKAHMARENFEAIPDEFRSMKRLWATTPGLQKRREREALLFERGLRAKPIEQPLPPDIDPRPQEDTEPKPIQKESFLKRWWKWITGSGLLGTGLTVGGVTLNAETIYALALLFAVVVIFGGIAFLIYKKWGE